MNVKTVEELANEAGKLSLYERALLIEKIAATMCEAAPTTPKRKRRAGIFAGEGWAAEDFDAPLGNEFWGLTN